MTIQCRGWKTATNSHGSATSVATSYASMNGGTAPQAGDLIVCVLLVTAASETITKSAGTGTWTIPASTSNAATQPFTSTVAYSQMAAGDTAPTFAFASASYSYMLFSLYSDAGGSVTFDTQATVKVDTTGATSHTPNTASASTAADGAIVCNAARYQTSGASAITVPTPCSGYSAVYSSGGIGGYAGASGYYANSCSAYIKKPVGSGTITPGAESFNETVANNAYLVLVKETLPETSPGLETYGFPISGPGAGDTINSVTVSVTEHQSNAAQQPCSIQLWDGTSAQIGTTQTGTASTSTSNVSTATWTGVTYSQLATLRVRVFGTALAGSGYVESVDGVSVVVNYTPASGGATTVTPGCPAGAGTAPAPTIATAKTVTPGCAAGTGAAAAPTAATGKTATPGCPAGTGSAPAPTLTTAASVSAPCPAGTGTASPATAVPGRTAVPGCPAGTGTAPAPTVATHASVSAPQATGTGSAPAPARAVTVNAGAATGAGTASGPKIVAYRVYQSGGGGAATQAMAATTAGTTLIATSTSANVVGTCTATDGTHTYTLSQAVYTAGHGGGYTGVYFLPNCPAGLTSVTVAGAQTVGFYEVGGLDLVTPVAGVTTGGSASTTSFSCASAATGPNQFSVFMMCYSASNGGTARTTGLSGDFITSWYAQEAYRIGTTAPSGTLSGTGSYDCAMVAFNPAGTTAGATWAGIQFVAKRGAAKVTAAAASLPLNPNGTIAAGNTAFASIHFGAYDIAGVKDTGGNVWHVDTRYGGGAICHAYLTTALTAADTVTAVLTGAATGTIELLEFSGVSQYAALDNDARGWATATATNITPGTFNGTTAPNMLVLTHGVSSADISTTVTWTPPPGWIEETTGLSPGNVTDCAWTIASVGTGQFFSPKWTQGAAIVMTGITLCFLPKQGVTQAKQTPATAGVYRGPCGIYAQDEKGSTAGGAASGILAYENWLGHHIQYPLDYIGDAPASWSDFENGILGQPIAGYTYLSSWGGTFLSRWTMCLALPACVGISAGSGGATWAAEAAGTNDAHWTALGNNLIAWGFGNANIRLGREWNGNWYQWSPALTGDSAANYIAGYQHIVTLLRNLTGAHFTFMWNPIEGQGSIGADAQTYYPGDAYTDQIGLDVYDWVYTNQTSPPYGYRSETDRRNCFTTAETATDGNNSWVQFARKHGKPLAYPEWGLVQWLSGGYNGGGDNPIFISQMQELVSYSFLEAFWEDSGAGLFDTDGAACRTANIERPDNARTTFLTLQGAAFTAAGAGDAEGAGTAPPSAPAAAATPSAPQASGTGTAPAPTIVTSCSPAPACPAGTGTAPEPSLTTTAAVSAPQAAGTGTAPSPSTAVTVSAPCPAGTGAASPAAAATAKAATAPCPAGTGTASPPVPASAAAVSVACPAGTGTAPSATTATAKTVTPPCPGGAGVASPATAASGVAAPQASGSGTASAASITTAAAPAAPQATGTGTASPATAASIATITAPQTAGTGTAPAASAASAAAPAAPQAAGTGAAPAPGISTTSSGQASPPAAAGTGTSPPPALTTTAAVAAGAASGTGSAPQPVTGTGAAPATPAGAATGAAPSSAGTGAAHPAPPCPAGTGTAPAPTITTACTPAAPAAAGTGTAPPPALTATAAVSAPQAIGTGTAPAASASTIAQGQASAGAATGTGTAPAVTAAAAYSATAGLASGTGTTPPATTAIAVSRNAGPSTGTGTAPPASITTTVSALAGLAAGTGTSPPPDTARTGTASPAAAAGTGTAPPSSASTVPVTSVTPACPAGTGTAPAPGLAASASVSAGPATGQGTSPHATGTGYAATSAQPNVATGTGTSPPPSITASTSVHPPAAAGTGTSPPPVGQGARIATPACPTGLGTAPVAALAAAAQVQALAALGLGTAPAPAITALGSISLLSGLAAGAPHGQWSTGPPRTQWSAGAPHIRWATGPPHSKWAAAGPHTRWTASSPHG